MAHKNYVSIYMRYILNIISLQTPAGRVIFFIVLTVAIFLAPYSWLAHLSIWGNLGIPSPSVGLTRAYHLLLHGSPSEAWQRNKLIFLVIAVGLPLIATDIVKLYKSYRGREHRQTTDRSKKRSAIILLNL